MNADTATRIIRGLLDNNGQNYHIERMSPSALDALQLCLEGKPDLSNSSQGGESLLAMGAHRPEGALLLVKAGAPIDPDIAPALSGMHGVTTQQNLAASEIFSELAIELARRAPAIDWYCMVKSNPGNIYEQVPAAAIIEMQAPGFNQALEDAQREAGLPVGRIPRMTMEERKEALCDVTSQYPQMFYLGDRDRAQVVRELLGSDISPDIEVEWPDEGPVLLLDSAIRYACEPSLIEAILDCGASV